MPDPKPKIIAGVDRVVSAALPGLSCDESTVAVNPTNPSNIIAAAAAYTGFSHSPNSALVSYSVDGGLTWTVSALPGVSGLDIQTPVLAFGVDGTAYLLVEEIGSKRTFRGFKSVDGGKGWTSLGPIPYPFRPQVNPWIATHPTRPELLYVMSSNWISGDSIGVGYSFRSDDHGATWQISYLDWTTNVLAPHLSIAADGTIHAVSFGLSDGPLRHLRSTDGGLTFTLQLATGTGRHAARVTSCVRSDGRLVVAWEDWRDGASPRIYYRVTDETGSVWTDPALGTPLFAETPTINGQFRPRLSVTGNGVVGCAFLALKKAKGGDRMQMMLAPLFELESGFEPPITVSDSDWSSLTPSGTPGTENPYLGSVFSYYGMHADATSFVLVWPDPRTGTQKLYFDRVELTPLKRPFVPHDEDITIHITSERWIVIRRRRGKIVEIVRVPGTPGGIASDITRALPTFGTRDTLEAGQRKRDRRIKKVLSDALEVFTDLLGEGKKRGR